MNITIKQYEQAADEKVSIGGIKWQQKFDVCIQCDSREEAKAIQAQFNRDWDSDAYGYAKRLAEAIYQKHYKQDSPEWKPLDTTLGVLTQIDNMTSGLVKKPLEQKPVVWMYQDKSTNEVRFQKHMRDFVDHGQTYETPLYANEWVKEPLDKIMPIPQPEPQPVAKMKELLEVQGRDGNWNLDPYMQGMYNGMELIVALAEGRDPVFRKAPENWLSAQPQREWQGLTDDEVDEAEKEFGVWRGRVAKQSFESGAWWANEKLLEKNT